ncbi:hypothetical protein NQZ79_g4247 [Umbelopsis isabellina]|nr:hypothetical protein NQZ79_g4247 [Umbelopsis isabellina]
MDDEDQSSFQPYLDDSNWYSTSGRPYATSSTKGKADKSSKEDSNQDNSLSDTDGVYDVPLSDSTRSKQQTGLDEDKHSDGDKLKSSPLYNDDKSSSYSDYSAIVTGKKTMLSTRIVTLTYAPPTSSVPDDVSSSKTSTTFSQATSIPSVRTIPNSLLITSSSSLSSSSLLSSISTIPTFKSSTLSSTTSIYSTSIISSSSIIAVSTSTPSYLPAIKDKSAPTPQNYTVPIVVGVIAGAVMIGMLAFAVVRMRKNRKTRQRWSTYTESAYRDPFGTSMEQSRHHSYSA